MPGKFIKCLILRIFWVNLEDIELSDLKINLQKYDSDSLFSMFSTEATSTLYYEDQVQRYIQEPCQSYKMKLFAEVAKG